MARVLARNYATSKTGVKRDRIGEAEHGSQYTLYQSGRVELSNGDMCHYQTVWHNPTHTAYGGARTP